MSFALLLLVDHDVHPEQIDFLQEVCQELHIGQGSLSFGLSKDVADLSLMQLQITDNELSASFSLLFSVLKPVKLGRSP